MPRLMLLDSNGLIYRGYHALPPLTTSKGELVNAVFGFCSILLRGIQDVRPGVRGRLLRSAGADLPPRAVRRVQGHPHADAGRPALAVPQGARGRGRAAHPRLRDGGLRGRRRDRHDHARHGRPGHRHDRRHRRPGHAPDRDRAHAPDDDSPGSRLDRSTTPREDLGAVRAAAGPDDRLQGPQGRPDGQHPGHPREWGRRRPRSWSVSSGRSRRSTSGCAEVKPDKLREKIAEAREQVFRSRELARIVRDLPDLAGPREGPSLRLRPGGGDPPLPRVRVPDAHRPAAAADRRVGGGGGRGPARGRRLGAGGQSGRRAGARRGSGQLDEGPRVRLALRRSPERWGRWHAAHDGLRGRRDWLRSPRREPSPAPARARPAIEARTGPADLAVAAPSGSWRTRR